MGNCHGHAQRRVTTVGTNLQNASTCLKRKGEKGRGPPLRRFSRLKIKYRVTKKTWTAATSKIAGTLGSLGITCQFKAYPHPTKALWHAEISTVLHCSISCPGHVSSLAPTWRTSFHCLPQHGGFMTPGHLVAPGKAEGKEVNGVNHLGYEDAKVWRIGSTPPPGGD